MRILAPQFNLDLNLTIATVARSPEGHVKITLSLPIVGSEVSLFLSASEIAAQGDKLSKALALPPPPKK